ncbi:long-chain fatty acid--CoA ligase [bacterium]|nr:long-chain fatty acid--CoA ligase [bacterium]
MSNWGVRPAWAREVTDGKKVAIWDRQGPYSYSQLDERTLSATRNLLRHHGGADLSESRVAMLVSPSFYYVVAQWSIWRAGGVTVPLCTTHPLPELEYVIQDAQVRVLIHDSAYAPRAREIQASLPGLTLLSIEELSKPCDLAHPLPVLESSRRAQILYTSGTTGKPKGVVTTHANLLAQVRVLLDQWGWTSRDHALHVLPLHHTHGIINVLCCALASGASLEFFERFDAQVIWDRFMSGREGTLPSVFMAVPTIYTKLIEAYEQSSAERQALLSSSANCLRLMVSGSAALPVPVFKKWSEITGHLLLERYGMTEIGMALSNPLSGDRRPGSVGKPLPGVEVRLCDGELQVRGEAVFLEYFGRPQETSAAFTSDGWFKTGDSAEVSSDGYYQILGRTSVDILKTGGYKVSALEIENELRACPGVLDVAVVGVPDEKWGDRVAAVVVLREGSTLEAAEAWLKERLAPYKVPKAWKSALGLPRNAMGKVTKKELLEWFIDPTKAGPSAEPDTTGSRAQHQRDTDPKTPA